MACACAGPAVRTEISIPANANPPGGLRPEQVPQFVCFGTDDNGYSGLEGSGGSGGLHFLSQQFSARKNPAGSNNPQTFDSATWHYSFYVNTFYITSDSQDISPYSSTGSEENPDFVKRAWQEAITAGHEIGVHTHSHPHGKQYSQSQWQNEIQRCIDILGQPYAGNSSREKIIQAAGLDIDRSQLAGFRTPFLEYNDNTLKAVHNLGFLYDCSLEEGTQPEQDGGNFLWPYRLDYGSPANPQTIGKHPGLWEIPVYVFIVPPDNECERYGIPAGLRAKLKKVQDYFDPLAGKITGMDWNLWYEYFMTPAEFLATLKYTLDLRLTGNRCPLTIGLHSEIYADKYNSSASPVTVAEKQGALREFFDYLRRLPQVRVVNNRELLTWLQQPKALAVSGE
jgi:peptidoglycan/xylan/chitin deacetylase (PgdA/CDA1 family)